MGELRDQLGHQRRPVRGRGCGRELVDVPDAGTVEGRAQIQAGPGDQVVERVGAAQAEFDVLKNGKRDQRSTEIAKLGSNF